MNTRHATGIWRPIVMSLLFIVGAMSLMSCGSDDEPKAEVIDYYVSVEEAFLVNGLTDHTDRYYDPIKRMTEAIRKAYPSPNAKGDDDGVIAACDEERMTYVSMYDGGAEHLTCLFHLVRVVKRGDVVRESLTLKTYYYDINATEIVE